MHHESLVIILAIGDARVDAELALVPDATVYSQRIEREGSVVCVAAHLRHADDHAEFGTRFRGWANARGWRVAVAPHGRVG